jgi:hypothetical protein
VVGSVIVVAMKSRQYVLRMGDLELNTFGISSNQVNFGAESRGSANAAAYALLTEYFDFNRPPETTSVQHD